MFKSIYDKHIVIAVFSLEIFGIFTSTFQFCATGLSTCRLDNVFNHIINMFDNPCIFYNVAIFVSQLICNVVNDVVDLVCFVGIPVVVCSSQNMDDSISVRVFLVANELRLVAFHHKRACCENYSWSISSLAINVCNTITLCNKFCKSELHCIFRVGTSECYNIVFSDNFTSISGFATGQIKSSFSDKY